MDCGLAPRCPNRFLSLDGKLLMDAIYDGDDWVDHYTWRLVGSNDNGDVVFDGLCPKHLHPFVSSLIESSARVAPYSSASLHDTDVLKTIRESIDEGTMSGPLFSRLVGLDEIGSKRLLAGESGTHLSVDDFNPAASRCSSQINPSTMPPATPLLNKKAPPTAIPKGTAINGAQTRSPRGITLAHEQCATPPSKRLQAA